MHGDILIDFDRWQKSTYSSPIVFHLRAIQPALA